MQACNRLALMIPAAIMALPLSASAVATTLNITVESEAVPSATIEIYDLEEPETVVEERMIDSVGPIQVDLSQDRAYGVRIKEGPVVVNRFESGDNVNVAIPLAFLKTALGWTFSVGLKGGFVSQKFEGSIEGETDKSSVTGGFFMPELEVMTPPVECVWGDPRFFLRVGGGFGEANDALGGFEIDGILESSLEAKYKNNWNLGLGVQLTADVAGHDVRFKPAVAYGQQSWRLKGTLDEFGVGTFQEIETHTMHIIRPELSVETPIANAGSVELAAILFGGVNINVGDDRADFTVEGEGGGLDFRSRNGSIGYDVGAGFRVSWSPLALR